VRLGVQFRQPKAASPPLKLDVRAAGGRPNFLVVLLLRSSSSVRQNLPRPRWDPRPRRDRRRRFLLGPEAAAVVPEDHSAVSVSTVRQGVQYRRPKAASPPQELEVRAAGGRADF
jgi:hypothetical protein